MSKSVARLKADDFELHNGESFQLATAS